MKRLLALAAVLVAGASLTGPASASGPTVYVQNLSTNVSDAEVQDALPAFQAAVNEDFAPEWNASGKLELTEVVPPGAWSIDLVDHPDCFFCAGWHGILNRAPFSQVGVAPDDPPAWQVTFSHELFELLADPWINRGMLVSPKKGAKPRWYALEVCDPVEADRLAYTRPSARGLPVHVSDFILESWFRRSSRGPWDFTAAAKKPLAVVEDGYQLEWTGIAWEWVPRSKHGHL